MTTAGLVTRSEAEVCCPARARSRPRRAVIVFEPRRCPVERAPTLSCTSTNITCESDLSGWPMDTRTRRFGVATSRASAGCSRGAVVAGLVLGLLVDHATGTSPICDARRHRSGHRRRRRRLLGPRPGRPASERAADEPWAARPWLTTRPTTAQLATGRGVARGASCATSARSSCVAVVLVGRRPTGSSASSASGARRLHRRRRRARPAQPPGHRVLAAAHHHLRRGADPQPAGRVDAASAWLVLSVVAVGIAVWFWPDGIGLLLGLAIFRLIALVMTTIPC